MFTHLQYHGIRATRSADEDGVTQLETSEQASKYTLS